METWEHLWTLWITEYREVRPPSGPIGWYNLTDMRAAFDAGAKADYAHGLKAITDRIEAAVRDSRPE